MPSFVQFKLVTSRSPRNIAPVLLIFICFYCLADSVRFSPVPRQLIEDRLEKYVGNNQQREANLKRLFTEAGCDNTHLSEQPVKGSKLPNVICVLPGSTDQQIIVGAHFDRASDGDGVAWTIGAARRPFPLFMRQ